MPSKQQIEAIGKIKACLWYIVRYCEQDKSSRIDKLIADITNINSTCTDKFHTKEQVTNLEDIALVIKQGIFNDDELDKLLLGDVGLSKVRKLRKLRIKNSTENLSESDSAEYIRSHPKASKVIKNTNSKKQKNNKS